MLDETPTGWSVRGFDELAELQPGFAFKSEKFTDSSEIGLPLIRIRDLVKQSPEKYIDEEVPANYVVENGDILVGMDGEFNCVVWRGGNAALNQRVLRVFEQSGTDRTWLHYLLQPILAKLESEISGTTVKHLSTKHLKKLAVPTPPLPEQERIAEILTSVDDSIRATDAVIAQAERVKRGLMEDLLTGGLGTEAIARGEVPEGWERKTLKEVCAIQAGYGFPNKYQGLQDEEYPFFKVSDMNIAGNEVYMLSANNTISEETRQKLKAKTLPQGSIVFPKIGAAIATNKKRILVRDSIVDNNVMGLVADNVNISETFLYYIILAKNLSDFASTAGVPSIRKSTLEDFQICLPTIAEQERIASALASIEEQVAKNRTTVDQLQTVKRGLMDDLLTGRVRTV